MSPDKVLFLAAPHISIPKSWPKRIQVAVLNVISLAHWAIIYTRSMCANSPQGTCPEVLPKAGSGTCPLIKKLRGKLERARNEISLLKEEIRIKDARFMRIKPRSRPHYSPFERLAILELQAARGWNKAQTAKTFMIDQDTIYSWTKRTDEQGKHAFIEIPEPINKFPQFVTYIVQRLKVLCPTTAKRQKKDPLTFLQALLARGAGCTRDILFAGFTPP